MLKCTCRLAGLGGAEILFPMRAPLPAQPAHLAQKGRGLCAFPHVPFCPVWVKWLKSEHVTESLHYRGDFLVLRLMLLISGNPLSTSAVAQTQSSSSEILQNSHFCVPALVLRTEAPSPSAPRSWPWAGKASLPGGATCTDPLCVPSVHSRAAVTQGFIA